MRAYRPSTEAERLADQAARNRRRLAVYMAKQQRIRLDILQGRDVPLELVPNSMWLRRQAD